MFTRGLNDQVDIVLVVEGTAVNGAFISELKANYLIPILEYFNQGNIDEDRNVTCGSVSNLFGLVVYHAADILPKPSSDCYGPYYSPKKLLETLDSLRFANGKGESHANIAEGLATALQAFQDLQQQREGANDLTEKHCILICNSPPYLMPVIESSTYMGYDIGQLANTLNKENINLSILSPRKIPEIFKLFEAAGGDLNQLQNKNYAVDPRHVVLLKGISLEGDFTSLTDEKENFPVPINENTLNCMNQQTSSLPDSSAVYKYCQNEAAAQQADQQFFNQRYVQNSAAESSSYQTEASSFNDVVWPLSSPYPIQQGHLYCDAQPSFGSMHSPAQLTPIRSPLTSQQEPQQSSFCSTQTWFESVQHPTPSSQAGGFPMSSGQMPLHTSFYVAPESQSNDSQSAQLLMSSQQLPQLVPFSNTHISSAAASHPIQSPSPQFPDSVFDQQKMEQLNRQPNMGSNFQDEQVVPSEMRASSLDYQSAMASQQRMNQNVTFPERGFIPLSSLSQNINQQQTLTVTTEHSLQGPVNQFQIGSVTSTSDKQLRHSGVVWQGTIEWTERASDDRRVKKQCRFQMEQILKEDDYDLNTTSWPSTLGLRLLPREIISVSGAPYLKSSTNLRIYPEQCEASESLTRIMSNDFGGCVCFTLDTAANPAINKVFVLLYSTSKKGFFGFIPYDQAGFVAKLNKVVKEHSAKMSMNNQNQISGNSSNSSSTSVRPNISAPAQQSGTSQHVTMATPEASVSNVQNDEVVSTEETESEIDTEDGTSTDSSSIPDSTQNCSEPPVLGLPVDPYRQQPVQYKMHPIMNEMKIQRKQQNLEQDIGAQHQVQIKQDQHQRAQPNLQQHHQRVQLEPQQHQHHHQRAQQQQSPESNNSELSTVQRQQQIAQLEQDHHQRAQFDPQQHQGAQLEPQQHQRAQLEPQQHQRAQLEPQQHLHQHQRTQRQQSPERNNSRLSTVQRQQREQQQIVQLGQDQYQRAQPDPQQHQGAQLEPQQHQRAQLESQQHQHHHQRAQRPQIPESNNSWLATVQQQQREQQQIALLKQEQQRRAEVQKLLREKALQQVKERKREEQQKKDQFIRDQQIQAQLQRELQVRLEFQRQQQAKQSQKKVTDLSPAASRTAVEIPTSTTEKEQQKRDQLLKEQQIQALLQREQQVRLQFQKAQFQLGQQRSPLQQMQHRFVFDQQRPSLPQRLPLTFDQERPSLPQGSPLTAENITLRALLEGEPPIARNETDMGQQNPLNYSFSSNQEYDEE